MGAEGNAPSPPVCKTGILLLDEAPFLTCGRIPGGICTPNLCVLDAVPLLDWATGTWSQRRAFHPYPPTYRVGAILCHAGI